MTIKCGCNIQPNLMTIKIDDKKCSAQALYDALEKMTSRGHFDTCDTLVAGDRYECTCGFVPALAALKKARAE